MLSSSVERTSYLPTNVTKVFEGHSNLVTSVAYFPNGRHIASGSWDKTIRIWNIETGQQEGEALEHNSRVKAIAVSPDGGKIAGRVDCWLIVWDVVRRKRVREVKMGGDSERGAYPLMVTFTPDGRWIATASSVSTSIWVWDVDTGNLVRELQQHVDTIWCLSFSPDGAHIATGSSDSEGSFRVLDISIGKTVVGPIRGFVDGGQSLVYSPDSRLLVTGSSDRSIRVWDAATGQQVGRPMLLPSSPILCIAISADGDRIASVSADQTVRLWNLETRLQVGDPLAGRAPNWIPSVAFSPNGRFVISGGPRDVCLWDTATVLASVPSPPISSNREPSASIVPSAHVAAHPSLPFLQQKQTASQAHRDTSSIRSSILDLPAVVQPKNERPREVERTPSTDDWDSAQSHSRPTTEPTKRENPNAAPSAAKYDNQWTHIIRRCLRHFGSHRPAHVDTLQGIPPKTPLNHSRTVPAPASGRRWSHAIHQNKSIRQIIKGQVDFESLPAQTQPPMRFWNRLRRSGSPGDISGPRGQKQPTSGVVDVAGGRDKVRLIMSPDTERYGVPPPEPVELPPIASRPPSFFEIEVDPLEGWSWSRELRELICCYWCFPRNRRPV